jgi:hypothetical protein
MNQISNTQRSVTTAGYEELLLTSLSNKLSPISVLQNPDVLSESKCSCVLWLLFVCIQLRVLKVSEEKKNMVFIEQGNANFFLLNGRQEETNKSLGELTYQVFHHSSSYSLIIYQRIYLQFTVPVDLPISVTVQIQQLTVHSAHKMAQ